VQIKQRLMPTLPVECWELGEGVSSLEAELVAAVRTYLFLAFPRPCPASASVVPTKREGGGLFSVYGVRIRT